MYKFLLSLLLSACAYNCFAQQRAINITGTVLTAESHKPLGRVVVQALQSNAYTTTNLGGRFVLDRQAAGRVTLTFTLLGRKPVNLELIVHADTAISVFMDVLSLSLKEVPVVAQQRKVGSSSIIGKTAIKHTQPTSLADALQLIPGQLALNPNLSDAQQINLRQVPSNTDAARAGALGTAIVLDGIPFSNNANLQTTVNNLSGSPNALPGFSSVAGRGNDLRQIPADQIESIEVIRGVPSVRYGDLTAGVILVNTRAGVFRPQFTTRLNPNLYEQTASVGIGLKNAHILTFDNDLTISQEDPRNTLSQFTRFTSQITWSKPWLQNNRLYTTTRLALFSTLDENKQDPDDLRYQRKVSSRDRGFRLSSNGKFQVGKGLFSSLSYDIGLSYTSQQSYLQELVTRDLFPVTDATTSGTRVGRYGESEYLSQLRTVGKPLSLYARLEGTLFRANARFNEQNNLSNQIIAGGEYRSDRNYGDGRQFDPSRPPRQNYSAGDRPRTYSEIPALQQLSYYAEDRLSATVAGKEVSLYAGIRYDNINPDNLITGKFGNVLAPRINLAIETLKGLRIKGGYGITAKAPTLSYIYPGNRYFDLVNYNYYAVNPAERLVVISTVIFDTTNEDLKSYRSRKFEAGFDFGKNGFYGYLTGFREINTGAYGTDRIVNLLGVVKYQASSFPPGQPPVLSPVPLRTDPFFAAYDVTANNRRIENTGLEFQFDSPPVTPINTAFHLTGAYIRTVSYDDGESVDANRAVFSDVTPARIPIYYSGFGNQGKRFNTSLRFDTRIPQFRFLISGLVQTVWVNSNRNIDLSTLPIGYVTNQGNTVYLSPAERELPVNSDLRRQLSGTLSNTNAAPSLWLFNVRVSKEFKNNSSFSFYINNVPADRGTYFNTVSQTYVRRNQELFFGAEFTVSL